MLSAIGPSAYPVVFPPPARIPLDSTGECGGGGASRLRAAAVETHAVAARPSRPVTDTPLAASAGREGAESRDRRPQGAATAELADLQGVRLDLSPAEFLQAFGAEVSAQGGATAAPDRALARAHTAFRQAQAMQEPNVLDIAA